LPSLSLSLSLSFHPSITDSEKILIETSISSAQAESRREGSTMDSFQTLSETNCGHAVQKLFKGLFAFRHGDFTLRLLFPKEVA